MLPLYLFDSWGKLQQAPPTTVLFRPAAYGILIENNQILLQRQPETGAWTLPGGIVPAAETPTQTVRQAVQLAAGFVPEVGPLLFVETLHRLEDNAAWRLAALYFHLSRPKLTYAMVDFDTPTRPEWISLNTLLREQLQSGYDAIRAAQAWQQLSR
ncbi:MAG: hypothetical protein Fur0021_23500 [Candidatus Promineifilaceae bacterium]